MRDGEARGRRVWRSRRQFAPTPTKSVCSGVQAQRRQGGHPEPRLFGIHDRLQLIG
jgi:hypothetical protein